MKQFAKKTLVVTTIALVMSSGATAALAEDASSPSTTVPTASTPKTIEINKNFATAMKEANTARRTARESATTKEAKKAAQIAFSAAITTAQNARTAALTALGDPPVKPVKTDDSSK